jgi:hypothetical protein
MIFHLAVVLFGAYMWAKLEVEIEGKDGWAKSLPTWRIEKHFLLDVFMGGRPLTGYHLWAFSFVAFAFHLPFLWMRMWSIPLECEILGSLMLFWVIEDFLWFMVNPHYGWQQYRRQNILWHRRWFWILPADHWGMIITSVALLAWSHYKS